VHAFAKFIWHWLIAVNEHSLHSPFLFNFYTHTIKRNIDHEDFNAIEQLRTQLTQSQKKILVTQLGANSKVNNQKIRAVSDIARKGISPRNTSELLFKIIQEFDFTKIIELGTSLGINTLYMATKSTAVVYTFEGCAETSLIAQANFKTIGYSNIKQITGDLNLSLPDFCSQYSGKIDLAFIDANHQYEPTLTYFNLLLTISHSKSIIIIDDIYWSREMTSAWEKIKSHPQVTSTIDLYKLGIVFFRPELEKQHINLIA